MEAKEDCIEKGKSPKKKYNLRKRKTRQRKKNEKKSLPSDDSDSDSDYLPPEDGGVEESDEEFDAREYQRFIQRLFPSKAGKDRLRQLDKLDKLLAKDKAKKNRKLTDAEDAELTRELEKIDEITNKEKRGTQSERRRRRRRRKSKLTKNHHPIELAIDEDALPSDDDEDDEEAAGAAAKADDSELAYLLDDEDEEMDEEEIKDMLRQNMKFNIIFTVGDPTTGGYDEDDSSDSDDSGDEETEGTAKGDKSEEAETSKPKGGSSKSATEFKKGDRVEVKCAQWDKHYPGTVTKVSKPGKLFDIELEDSSFELLHNVRTKHIRHLLLDEEYDDLIEELRTLCNTKKKGGDKGLLAKFEQFAELKAKRDAAKKRESDNKAKLANAKKLRRLLKAKDVMNDFKYFKTMAVGDQKKILAELRLVNKYAHSEKPYRLALLESNIPAAFKANALRKINTLNYMDPGSGEYYKIKQWVDTFMQIPFDVNRKLSVSMDQGKEACQDFMENAKKILDDAVYGLDDAKMQIMQYVGQLISNPSAVGTAIAIQGPMGTGKTTLIKEGISKILQRPFAFLALGGATDSSFLEGHSYTYEGSMWGKVVDIIIRSKCMNPVIYFDELDKVSDTPKGEEIIGILTHLTDTAQNTQYHDKYFANIDFDLSKALFIFSYNDEAKVNPILRDRMYRITTQGYDCENKTTIAKGYLIPSIEKNINFEKGQICISDDVIAHIISTFTDGEKGVRNLRRCLEIIYTKINLYRLMKPDSSLFEKESSIKVEFPFTVTREIVDKLVKRSNDGSVPFGMYM